MMGIVIEVLQLYCPPSDSSSGSNSSVFEVFIFNLCIAIDCIAYPLLLVQDIETRASSVRPSITVAVQVSVKLSPAVVLPKPLIIITGAGKPKYCGCNNSDIIT